MQIVWRKRRTIFLWFQKLEIKNRNDRTTMQKQFQRLMSAVALAASVHLWAMPRVSALAPAQEEEPALYYDPYGAAFYLTPEEADTLLPDLDAEPVVLEVPEEDLTPTQDEDTQTASAEEDAVATMPDPDSDHAFDKTDAGFNVTPEPPEEELPKQTPAADVYSEPETISVEVTWGSMNFEYVSGEWDTENLCYKADGSGKAGWQPTETNGNKITFTNSGNVAVNVQCTYQSDYGYDGYTATFATDTGSIVFDGVLNTKAKLVPLTALYTGDGIDPADETDTFQAAGELEVLVTLTGPRPAEEMTNRKIGTITATISAAKQTTGTSDTTS